MNQLHGQGTVLADYMADQQFQQQLLRCRLPCLYAFMRAAELQGVE